MMAITYSSWSDIMVIQNANKIDRGMFLPHSIDFLVKRSDLSQNGINLWT